jgi:hypothetical protein
LRPEKTALTRIPYGGKYRMPWVEEKLKSAGYWDKVISTVVNLPHACCIPVPADKQPSR